MHALELMHQKLAVSSHEVAGGFSSQCMNFTLSTAIPPKQANAQLFYMCIERLPWHIIYATDINVSVLLLHKYRLYKQA